MSDIQEGNWVVSTNALHADEAAPYIQDLSRCHKWPLWRSDSSPPENNAV